MGRKKLSIKFALEKVNMHRLKRIRVECCWVSALTVEAYSWAFPGINHRFHEIEEVSTYHACLLSATFQRRRHRNVEGVESVQAVEVAESVESVEISSRWCKGPVL